MRCSRRRWRLRAAAIPALAILVLSGCGDSTSEDPGELRDARRTEGAPMCPWRNPSADVALWFPGSTRSDTEVRILSGVRPELAQRLGRQPTAGENALYVHRIWRGTELLGEVATTRVKGESGAVELAVAFEPDGRVHGVRVQRSREPEPIANVLQNSWLASFQGKTATDLSAGASTIPAVPPEARTTGTAIMEGVRSLCILREMATRPGILRRPAPEAAAHLH
ncbi:MAG: hypothetical protein JNL10_15690 [Verrucomicrobiales bacterium]|nr:hypothetical protein [Verrucomicrobiales bacterium]